MNHEIAIGKCGCDCRICPTYKDNLRTLEDREHCSSGWQKYLDVNLSPEKLRACDGCSLPDSERNTCYLNCKVRKCCMVNTMQNCAYCTDYPCRELKEVHHLQNIQSADDYTFVTGKAISLENYLKFIEPYAGLKHLDEIRIKLDKSQITGPKKYSLKSRFKTFPALRATKPDLSGLKRIYTLLTTLDMYDGVSYARYLSLKKSREQLLRILWAIALYGDFSDGDGSFLTLEGKRLLSQKVHGMYPKVMEYLKELKNHRVCCEIIPLDLKKWKTPAGGLRKEGWMIRMSFGEDPVDVKHLVLLKRYAHKLKEKYRERAFKYFGTADLTVMADNHG